MSNVALHDLRGVKFAKNDFKSFLEVAPTKFGPPFKVNRPN